MARKSGISKMSAKKIGGERLDFAVLKFTAALGEKKNYNFQPEVTEYKLWPFSTIEWVPAEGKYKARAIVRHKTTHDMVVFNSWHQDYGDAEPSGDCRETYIQHFRRDDRSPHG